MEERSTQVLLVDKILFTQKSVADHFADGQKLNETVRQLASGEIMPAHIPPMRVVLHNGRWYALDNRRLWVFKNAGMTKVGVIVCSLQDPKIKTEFELKKSNKSFEGGGAIRSAISPFSSVSFAHFDQGAFTFTKIVLNWNFTQIKLPLMNIQQKNPLPERFPSSRQYFSAFKDFVLEEARAILQQGIELAEKNQAPFLRASLGKVKFAKTYDNPGTLEFFLNTSRDHNDWSPKPGDMVLLEKNLVCLTGMIAYLSKEERQKRLSVKVVIDQEARARYSHELDARSYDQWQVTSLGSLITQMRIYEVCCAQPESKITQAFLQGEVFAVKKTGVLLADDAGQEILFEEEESEGQAFFAHLNDSQNKAIGQFVDLQEGVQLVQGPPGTGKTSTVVALLEILIQKEPSTRILVSAASNKAVQLLAEKFVAKCPDVPCVLAGVEDRLPEDNASLEKIFLHGWQKNLTLQFAEMIEIIKNIQKTLKKTDEEENFFTEEHGQEIAAQIEQIEEFFRSCLQSLQFYPMDILGSKEYLEKNMIFFLDNLQKYGEQISALEYETGIAEEDQKLLNKYAGDLLGLLTGWQLQLGRYDSEEIEKRILNSAVVIFATLSVCGRKSMKEMQAVETLIIDEAGQAVEAECLIPLQAKPKRCLLVGDTKQLPATVISTEAVRFKYDRSLLYRLLEDCGQPYAMLDVQYRMHPEISAWPNQQYYGGRLRNHKSVEHKNHLPLHLQKAPDFLCPYAFIHVDGREKTERGNYSYFNLEEARAIEQILQYLERACNVNIAEQVGIVTFYKAQVFCLEKQLGKKYPGMIIKTVDGFQGGENDMTIISFVRANANNTIGFVRDERRLNVALTRAKFANIIIGNGMTLASSKNSDIQALVTDARAREKYYHYDEVASRLNPAATRKKMAVAPQKFAFKPKVGVSVIGPKKTEETEPVRKSHVPKLERTSPVVKALPKPKKKPKPPEKKEKKPATSHVPKIAEEKTQSRFFKPAAGRGGNPPKREEKKTYQYRPKKG